MEGKDRLTEATEQKSEDMVQKPKPSTNGIWMSPFGFSYAVDVAAQKPHDQSAVPLALLKVNHCNEFLILVGGFHVGLYAFRSI